MKRRIRNNKKEWKCDMCNQWFELDEEWDKKGAKEENECPTFLSSGCLMATRN